MVGFAEAGLFASSAVPADAALRVPPVRLQFLVNRVDGFPYAFGQEVDADIGRRLLDIQQLGRLGEVREQTLMNWFMDICRRADLQALLIGDGKDNSAP